MIVKMIVMMTKVMRQDGKLYVFENTLAHWQIEKSTDNHEIR